MSESLEVKVLPVEARLMIKEIIYGRLKLSRGLLRRMKRGGAVMLNGRRAFITERVLPGDVISIHFFNEGTEMQPESMPLDIVFEDDYLMVLNKAPGVVVHPTGSYKSGTLANGLADYWGRQGLCTKIRFVHRLDRDTSGLLLVAKEPYTHQKLVTQLRERTLMRTYLALLRGEISPRKGFVDSPIGISDSQEDRGMRRCISPEGKGALTFFEHVQSYDSFCLVKLRLATGRTHQIRVHMASLGCPVLGDSLYGEDTSIIPRQALHAWIVQFEHPRTGEIVQLRAPLPSDIMEVIRERRHGNGKN